MSESLLQAHGLKATKQRQLLLTVLQHQRRPRTVEYLQAQLPAVSLATAYRMMDDFLRVGLVNRIDLGHGHTHYEFADPKRHHHHLVCDNCGRIQDVTVPKGEQIVSLVGTRHHFQVQQHSMEFFGLCANCQ